MQKQPLRVDKNMPFLTFDQLARVKAVRINLRPPFSALLTRLAINDARRGAGFTFEVRAAFEVQHVMDAIQRTVIPPVAEITIHRAFGGRSLGM